jgi:hypothetical protein
VAIQEYETYVSTTFSRNLDERETARFAALVKSGDPARFTVSAGLQRAADDQIIAAAKHESFRTGRPLIDCINFIAAQRPDLLRISRARVSADLRHADAVLAGET